MQSIWNSKGGKLHTRNIEVSTYECDGQRIIVEGCLKDDRFQDSYTITGEIFPRGVIHHMRIRMLVNCSNFLEDIDVDLAAVQTIMVDRDFFQVYTKLNTMRENNLGSTLDWNYFHHVWRIYSASPFANAVYFTTKA